MRSSSPYNATVAVVIADAEALTALAAAVQELREIEMPGCALITGALLRLELSRPGGPRWAWTADLLEWLIQQVMCRPGDDAQRKVALDILERTFDTATRAWECRAHCGALINKEGVA